jgi:hypothetical protein
LKAELLPQGDTPAAPKPAAASPVPVSVAPATAGPLTVAPVAVAPVTPKPTQEPSGPAVDGVPPHLAALRELKDLLDRGALTQEEFVQQKAALLAPKRSATGAGSARVVGCPRCGSKLRAKKPGVVQCPKCQAKVRVAESFFSGGPGV